MRYFHSVLGQDTTIALQRQFLVLQFSFPIHPGRSSLCDPPTISPMPEREYPLLEQSFDPHSSACKRL